jgi:hypothetical protein
MHATQTFRLAAVNERSNKPLSWSETARINGLRMLLGRRYSAISESVAAELAARDAKRLVVPADVELALVPDVGEHPNLAA